MFMTAGVGVGLGIWELSLPKYLLIYREVMIEITDMLISIKNRTTEPGIRWHRSVFPTLSRLK
jgi:hypothetical protein